jgi:GNAT superfamily N-acetyltransferase
MFPDFSGKLHFRNAADSDEDLLWRFLAIAAYEPDAEAAKRSPMVASHLAGWRRTGDFGVVAELSGVPVGAAWARQFTPEENPSFFVAADVPEVSVGVLPGHRGKGVGSQLLERLTRSARSLGCGGLTLNVRDTNPAIRLYQQAGYRFIEGAVTPNRVGGLSIGMLLDLEPDVFDPE